MAGVLRVRWSRRPSEPDPVSTGDRESDEVHLRSGCGRARQHHRDLGLQRGRRAGRRRSRRRGPGLRRPGHPRVLPAAQEGHPGVRGDLWLRPDRPRRRRRRDPDHEAGPDHRQPHGRRGLRRRQHLCVARHRRGGLRRSRRRPAARGRGLRPGWGGRRPARSRGQQQRLRQRRRDLVRRPRPRAARLLRGPRRPAVRRAVRHPIRALQLAGARVPARHRGRVRRGLARLLGAADGQRHPRGRRLDRRLLRGVHPGRRAGHPPDRAVLRLLAGVHPGRRRRLDDEGIAGHLLPAGGVRRGPRRGRQPRGCAGAGRLPAERQRAGSVADEHVRLPGGRRGPAPPDWARHAVQPESPYQLDPDEIAENREAWLEEWREIVTR